MSPVRFTSTRDPDVDVDFKTAALQGQPPDGGLFVPASIPQVDHGSLGRDATVADVARMILPEWIGGELVDALDLNAIFSFPILRERLPDGSSLSGIQMVELFHGPTGSFKDFGARFLAACLRLVRSAVDRPGVVIVATSGDTGSAVADAFSSLPGFGVAILYPKGRVSPVQEAQLTLNRPGVWAFAVEGSFDDCQKSVKTILSEGIESADVLSANSINVGRLLPQMLFYFCAQLGRGHRRPVYAVPCGNLGNLTAGILARSSGIRDAAFLAATNRNDYFSRVLADPESSPGELVQTLSNAMDVAQPSNLERILWLYGRDELAGFLEAGSVGDEETVSTMRRIYEETGYVADPHTAVALAAVARHRAGLRRAGAVSDTSNDAVSDTSNDAVSDTSNEAVSDTDTDTGMRPVPDNERYSVIATADPAKYHALVSDVIGDVLEEPRFSAPPEPPSDVVRPDDVREVVREVANRVT